MITTLLQSYYRALYYTTYCGHIPAVSEQELQTVRVSGLYGLTHINEPHLHEEK